MFLFKKIVAPLLFPLQFSLEVMLLGLIFLLFTRRQKLAKALLAIGLLILVLFSYQPVSDRLLASLEQRYHPVVTRADVKAPVKWIVVLGGGHVSDRRLPPSDQLTTTTLARLMEGIRLYHLFPGSKLLLSGGGFFGSTPDARVMARTAVLFGVNQPDIELEDQSKDTEDEARLIRPMLRDEPFLLVTSASHMHRSMRLFLKQGMKPIAAPADFLVRKDEAARFSPSDLYPGTDHLECSERAIYEYLGILWTKLLGRA